ncbi:Os01g0888132 [Oryza sativa Japonica Group]|uniref:Uncharacterized protein n=2 Tax=Oryza sativa subsp. japonica TaxID=39947 RepID=A3CC26_ORYSJ|nr:hypothetical protein OsJ_34161 [Oryza sativa Japonica Group]BAD82139.1 hypothetical protein [Oryza sativa Japonica Group]BAD82366.1 hypothetical protein [Oryza sativa Japonica Group]BAS75630.1 Os01g0888132 [Oryza sativa Japonica Group]
MEIAMSSKRAEELEQLIQRMEQAAARRRKTQPAGSKRKVPEPDTFCPTRWLPTPESLRESEEKHQAFMRGAREVIREADEALESIALQQRGDSCDEG